MLVLFDIDGTLLLTGEAGYRAVREAAARVLDRPVRHDKPRLAGRLDPEIFRDICEASGVADPERHQAAFRSAYAGLLRQYLVDGSRPRVLPGARELVVALAATEGVTVGLLTGNYRETGRIKVETAGFDPGTFSACAWGADAPDRRGLVPVALRRHAELSGRPIDASQVLIIGDTPRDVDCARAHGSRSLAVATGPYAAEQLAEAGADRVEQDLTATRDLVDWIVAPRGA